jgi:hypothetical protein
VLGTRNRSARRIDKSLKDEAAGNAEGVGDEVGPAKGVAENQMADGGVAEGDEPGRLTEFEGFDGAGGGEGQNSDVESRGFAKDNSPAEKYHERPQCVAGIFAEEGRQKAGETAGGEAGDDGCQYGEEITGSRAEAWLEEDGHWLRLMVRGAAVTRQ